MLYSRVRGVLVRSQQQNEIAVIPKQNTIVKNKWNKSIQKEREDTKRHYHLVWPPSASKTACNLSGMLSIKLSITSWGIKAHSSQAAENKSVSLWGLCSILENRLQSRRLSSIQTFSMGLRSGKFGGQGS